MKLILLVVWLGIFAASLWQETQEHHSRFDLWLEPAQDLHKDSVIFQGLPYMVCRRWNRYDLATTLFRLAPNEINTSRQYPGECQDMKVRFIPQTREEKIFRVRETGADLVVGLTFTVLLFHLGYAIKERIKCQSR